MEKILNANLDFYARICIISMYLTIERQTLKTILKQ